MKIDKKLTSRLPKNGNDVEGVKELLALGYPAIAPVLPHLFQWLETGGPVVESAIQPFFAELGAPARDLACKALEASIKPALKYRLLRYVLPTWPRDVLITLPLEQLLQQYDFYGLDVWALKLMIDKRIPGHSELEEWRKFKIRHLKELLEVLDS
ncbi:hypothetical protein ACHAC9_23580 [Massilia sp. CMS3.1]|uniref:hypothetical protein n=1 Tax=Massilia sp. CMS3.1 TaxID=3373083 RepID=UPI003EE4E6D6